MDFYNPYQARNPSGGNVVNATSSPTLPPGYTGPKDPNNGAAGQMLNQKDKFGQLTYTGGLRDPSTNTGITFETNAKIAAMDALRNTMSTANPDDYAGMDEMRNYYRSALADLPGNSANQVSSFDTQAQNGLRNNLAQYRNANAGRGSLGSRQYAGAQGDIMSRANSDYMTGLIKARADALDQAGKIGSGLSGIQNTNLAERQYQTEQGQNLSSLDLALMNADMGRDSGLAQMEAQKDAANKAMWGQIIGGLAGGAGTAIGKSDIRAKKNIRDASESESLGAFRKAKPFSYQYKDERDGAGNQVSPMAQDLQAAGMGDCVSALPDGTLVVNYGMALGRMFAAISTLVAKIDRLEGALKNG